MSSYEKQKRGHGIKQMGHDKLKAIASNLRAITSNELCTKALASFWPMVGKAYTWPSFATQDVREQFRSRVQDASFFFGSQRSTVSLNWLNLDTLVAVTLRSTVTLVAASYCTR